MPLFWTWKKNQFLIILMKHTFLSMKLLTIKKIRYFLFNDEILVHCAQGKSRSATIVVMYLMRNKQWTFDKAVDYAKKRRDIICINEGF